MCIFCAAVPVTAAIGANLNTKQNATRRAAEEKGIEPPAEETHRENHCGSAILPGRGFGGLSYDYCSDLWITLVLILPGRTGISIYPKIH